MLSSFTVFTSRTLGYPAMFGNSGFRLAKETAASCERTTPLFIPTGRLENLDFVTYRSTEQEPRGLPAVHASQRGDRLAGVCYPLRHSSWRRWLYVLIEESQSRPSFCTCPLCFSLERDESRRAVLTRFLPTDGLDYSTEQNSSNAH